MKKIFLLILIISFCKFSNIYSQDTLLYNPEIMHYENKIIEFEKKGNKNQISFYNNKIAYVYWEAKKYNNAITHFNKSLNYNLSIGNNNAVRTIYNYIGMIYSDIKKHNKALEYLKKSLEVSEKINNKKHIISSLIYIASEYKMLSEYKKSNQKLNKAIVLANEIKDIRKLRTCYSMLAENYEKLGNSEKSIEYYNFFLTFDKLLKEREISSIKNQSKLEVDKAMAEKKAKELELKFKNYNLNATKDSLATIEKLSKQKQLKINLLNKEKALSDLTIKEQDARNDLFKGVLTFIIIGFVIVLFFSIILIKQMQKNKKSNVLLRKQNKEISFQKEEIEKQANILDNQNKELEKLSVVASKTSNSVIVADKHGKLEWVNEAFTNLWGYTFDEFKKTCGVTLKEASHFPEFDNIFKKCISEKRSISYVSKGVNKNKNAVWVQTSMTPIYDDDNKLSKIITIDSDITKIKNAETKIRDSILYAKRIQSAILKPDNNITKDIIDFFIYFNPLGIVSGDYYWMKKIDGQLLIVAADSTGHGVPGAFMSMLGVAFLTDIVTENNIEKTDIILNELRQRVKSSLGQKGRYSSNKDGMDIAICSIDYENKKLLYSGAYNPIFYIRDNKLTHIKADKMPIGIHRKEKPFSKHEINIEKNDCFYIFSDGYMDQFGGIEDKKYGMQNFKKLLLKNHKKPLIEQNKLINDEFVKWMGNKKQVDDILVIGFKIN